MKPEQVRTAAQARTIVTERGLQHVKVGVFDNDGVLRGKYMGRDKFFAALDKGFGFCDVVLGWDSNDQLYDNVTLHRLAHGVPGRSGPGTAVDLSRCAARRKHAAVPQRVRRAGRGGLSARACCARCSDGPRTWGTKSALQPSSSSSCSKRRPESVRAKGYRDLKTMTPGYFGYSALRSSVHAEFYHQLLDLCGAMRIPLESLHTETGPGVLEAAIQYTEALEAADRAALFKTFTKVLAQRNGMMATFMAKWSKDWPGQSGHLHVSLSKRKGGAPVFHDPKKPHGMSNEMRWFVGGQQALMPELLAMVASHGQQLLAPDPGLLGADRGELGRRESHDRVAGHSRRTEEPARRVPHRRGRHQSLRGAGRGDRVRPVGDRAPHRARSGRRGQCLQQDVSGQAAAAAHALRSG